MTGAENNSPWLAQGSYDRLRSKLEVLYENRPVITAETNERREEGDLKENAGCDAAREQQEQEEARVRYLEDLLQRATVGGIPQESGVALIGTVVHVHYDGDEDDTETFLIGTRGADSSNPNLETYSADSPLDRALVGTKEGETRTYTSPGGDEVSVTVIRVEPYNPKMDA